MSPPSPSSSSVPQRKPPPTTPSESADDASKNKASGAPAELAAVVDDLLDSLSKKFATVSTEIFEKMDSMSRRLDAMEQALNNSAEK